VKGIRRPASAALLTGATVREISATNANQDGRSSYVPIGTSTTDDRAKIDRRPDVPVLIPIAVTKQGVTQLDSFLVQDCCTDATTAATGRIHQGAWIAPDNQRPAQ
jgi:hypothetical protein